MKLLICTQKVDKEDDILGFFHSWLIDFAKNAEKITVICLEKGIVELPKNVEVFSLGKEKVDSGFMIYDSRIIQKIKYALVFWKYIWQKRSEYDTVFVHMNKEYILLGAPVWFIFYKKIVFWYNHKVGTVGARIAGFLSDKILYTGDQSFFADHFKSEKMPVGIDENLFKKNLNVIPSENSFLYIGRISPVKNLDVLIDAAKLLLDYGCDFKISIYGGFSDKDKFYYEAIREKAKSLEENKRVVFEGAVPNYKTPEIFERHEFAVNMTLGGSLDKTIFEAMAFEMPVISANQSMKNIWTKEQCDKLLVTEKNPKELALKMKSLINSAAGDNAALGKSLREIAVQNHSLSKLSEKLFKIFRT